MRGVCIVMLISLSVLALAEGIRVRPPVLPPPCPRACTRDYRPRCAVWKRAGRTSVCTFSNPCTLENQICLTGQSKCMRTK
ncbi:hypothetical protein KR059_000759 [Drosophila kikkawai]|nr:hypothetical protein KR059_000759 [Drosophila kikkawai]